MLEGLLTAVSEAYKHMLKFQEVVVDAKSFEQLLFELYQMKNAPEIYGNEKEITLRTSAGPVLIRKGKK